MMRHLVSSHPSSPCGAAVFAAYAVCGAILYSKTQLIPGSPVVIGQSPHCDCAKCFPINNEKEYITLDTDPFSAGELYDDKGKKSTIIVSNDMGRPVDDGRIVNTIHDDRMGRPI